MHMQSKSPGTLYIVATPIGNLEDITLRALRILKEVDLIAAEDTRHTKKLLNHFGIHTPLISYYREKEQQKGAEIISRLQDGANVALVSDAGTPGISDPGAVVVGLAHGSGLKVSPIPGPSALAAAVSAAGLNDGGFLFIGFAPAKKNQRRQLLDSLAHARHPLVFYEAPRRVTSFLTETEEVFGANRQVLIARELTKAFEEILQGTLGELRRRYAEEQSPARGEFVVIIGPGKQEQPTGASVEELLLWYRDHSDLSLKDTCRRLATDLGLSRSQIYQQALEIWRQ